MAQNWIPFHEDITRGKYRGVPRALRFCFLELCLLARPKRGVIELPLGMTDREGVADLLGGNAREVAAMLAIFTASHDGDDAAMRFEGPAGARRLIIPGWQRRNPGAEPAGASTERVRNLRERRRNEGMKRDETDHVTVVSPLHVTVGNGDQIRGEEIRREHTHSAPARTYTPERAHAEQPASQRAPSAGPDSDRGVPEDPAEILAMLAAHPALADVATEPMAQHALGLAIGAGKRREWVRRAISDLARDAGSAAATGKPWSEDYLGTQLGRYVDRAREDRARTEFQTAGRGKVAAADQSPVDGPAGALLGKWSATYASSKRGYGIYLPSPDDPAIVERLAMRAADAAGQPGVSHSAEDILAHWFRSYLRNDGAKGFYVEKRHALVWLERNLNDFGLPAEKKPRRPLVAEEPAEPTEEALRERDAFLSKAATFGNGGNGARVERPRHNDNGKA